MKEIVNGWWRKNHRYLYSSLQCYQRPTQNLVLVEDGVNKSKFTAISAIDDPASDKKDGFSRVSKNFQVK